MTFRRDKKPRIVGPAAVPHRFFRMKVLRIIARLNVGGPARHVVWLTQALQDEEFESKLIAGTVPEGEEDMAYFAAEHGVEPIYIEEMSRELSLKDIVSLWKVYNAISRERPDIIHTHTAKAGTVGRVAAFLYRWLTWRTLIGKPRPVRVVHTFHGHVFHGYYGKRKSRLFIFIERVLARLATDKIIVITRQQFDEIHKTFRIGEEKQFEIVPLGIDLSRLDNANREIFRSEIGAADDEVLIGYVGRLTEIKNLSLLLNAAAEFFRHEAAPATRFVLIGDGHLREKLVDEANRLGIADSVVFAGNRDDTSPLYAGLDIVALTSLNEGTPLSLIEAMASGRAAISTAVGGVVDLLGAEVEAHDDFSIRERGISVVSEEAHKFAEGLIYLAKNERLRKSLGDRGKAFTEKNYDKKRLIEDIKGLYRRLAGNGS
jgi:glycosyltransferase involved in cell wall biosynthesis